MSEKKRTVDEIKEIDELENFLSGCGESNIECISNWLTQDQIREVAEQLWDAGYRKQEWISVEGRLPTEEENDRGLVGIVNGYNGKIRFTDAIIFVDYDFDEKEWRSQDYDLTDCKVECWMPLPEAPKMKGGAE